jgi:hypothetical protein
MILGKISDLTFFTIFYQNQVGNSTSNWELRLRISSLAEAFDNPNQTDNPISLLSLLDKGADFWNFIQQEKPDWKREYFLLFCKARDQNRISTKDPVYNSIKIRSKYFCQFL